MGVCDCTFVLSAVKDRPEISSPVDFEHTVHVGFNQNTGEFTVSKGILCVCMQAGHVAVRVYFCRFILEIVK